MSDEETINKIIKDADELSKKRENLNTSNQFARNMFELNVRSLHGKVDKMLAESKQKKLKDEQIKKLVEVKVQLEGFLSSEKVDSKAALLGFLIPHKVDMVTKEIKADPAHAFRVTMTFKEHTYFKNDKNGTLKQKAIKRFFRPFIRFRMPQTLANSTETYCLPAQDLKSITQKYFASNPVYVEGQTIQKCVIHFKTLRDHNPQSGDSVFQATKIGEKIYFKEPLKPEQFGPNPLIEDMMVFNLKASEVGAEDVAFEFEADPKECFSMDRYSDNNHRMVIGSGFQDVPAPVYEVVGMKTYSSGDIYLKTFGKIGDELQSTSDDQVLDIEFDGAETGYSVDADGLKTYVQNYELKRQLLSIRIHVPELITKHLSRQYCFDISYLFSEIKFAWKEAYPNHSIIFDFAEDTNVQDGDRLQSAVVQTKELGETFGFPQEYTVEYAGESVKRFEIDDFRPKNKAYKLTLNHPKQERERISDVVFGVRHQTPDGQWGETKIVKLVWIYKKSN